MSSSMQNTILAHRSIYGDQSQNDSSSTEYKTVSFKKKPLLTPRRLTNQKIRNNTVLSLFNEKSQLLFQIANLKDEIIQLNKDLDEKMKNFTYSELYSIFNSNQDSRHFDTNDKIFQESATLDRKIEDLSNIFDSDSIDRLDRSIQNQKIILSNIQEDLENQKTDIQDVQNKINKIRNSDIFQSIFNQRKEISEKHKQIHHAVKIHRKLKEKLRQLEDYDSTRIQELEKTLLEAQENKERITKQYHTLQKKHQKEKTEAKAEVEKYKKRHKIVISSVLQSFEICPNSMNHNNNLQQSAVTFEKILTEADNGLKTNESTSSSLPKPMNYIQENDILMNSDFEIATQLLSESEDGEYNESIFEEEDEKDETEKETKSQNKRKQKKTISKDKPQKAEFINNSIQCEIKDNEQTNKSFKQINRVHEKAKDELPSFLFPPEIEIESTSIIYSESDISSSQIEMVKKERKLNPLQINSNNDLNKTEIHLNSNNSSIFSSCSSSLNNEIKKDYNNDLQSESTSIYNSEADLVSLPDTFEQNTISESTSIITSESYFKFTKEQNNSEKIIGSNNIKTKIIKKDTPNFLNFDHDIKRTNDIVQKETPTNSESEDLRPGDMVILETSKPITFESPDNSDQSQITTGGEITEYLSSQPNENENEDKIIKEKEIISHSLVPDYKNNIKSLKNSKLSATIDESTSILSASSDFFHEKNSFNNQKIDLIKQKYNKNTIQKRNIQNKDNKILENSNDSSRRKKLSKKSIKITNDEDVSSYSLFDSPNDHYVKNVDSFNCQPAALMPASDDNESNSDINDNSNHHFLIEDENNKHSSSFLSNRRQRFNSDQSEKFKHGTNFNDNDEEILDNMFVAEDDRKILKIGSFSKKPSKRDILPYFVRFGTVISYISQQDNSSYYVYITFKKHSAAKNAKKSLNGSKIAETRLKITLESETTMVQNAPETNSS